MTALDTKLLPCPHCGGDAERFTITEADEVANVGGDVITCGNCGASSHVEFGEKANLVDAWNRRVSPSQVAPANPAQVTDADLTARLKEIAVEVFPSANKFAVAEGVKNLIRILERIEPSEYAVLHRSMFPFSYDRFGDDGQPTEAQEWSDYDPDC